MSELLCSLGSLAADEPLIGTAPRAAAWVCLEQPGAWGPKALTESGLDANVGAAFENRTTNRGIRPALIRRPGRHPLVANERPWVFVAWTRPPRPWLYAAQLDSPFEILDLDLDPIAEGLPDLPAYYEPVDHEVLFVCTNGRRDQCCARSGRPVVEAAAAAHPDRVWETTHLSGHRFAATTLLLPSGNLHGRVADAGVLLDAADRGDLILDGWRGRSSWTAEGQAAERAVRELTGETGLNAITSASETADLNRYDVQHDDGRSWSVDVTPYADGSCAQSCGKEALPITRFSARVASAT